MRLFLALRRVVDASEQHADAVSSAMGMHRSDADALLHLQQAEAVGETVTASDVSRAVRLSPSATSALLSRLETTGHVTRTSTTRDKRQVAVHLTERGRSVLELPVSGLLVALAGALDRHADDELSSAAGVLEDVAEAIEGHRARLESGAHG